MRFVVVPRVPRLIRSRLFYSSLSFNNEEAEFANRKKKILEFHKQYYPTLSQIRDISPTRIPEFRSIFQNHQWDESKRIKELYSIEGKISSIRKSGKGMIFIDVIQDFEKIQLVLSNKFIGIDKNEFGSIHEFFKPGDFINAVGYPGITNVGELSLKCSKVLKLASPTLHPLPPKLTDSEKRHHNKVVDYLVNKKSQQHIIIKSLVVSSIRKFLDNRGFIEVTTPIISNSTKGANATPFITSSKYLKDNTGKEIDLQLRVAPELWLKKLIIGGFDKVYEIGSNFRNEGIDATHNPEFTTCEFYQTFTDLEELMKLSELLLQSVLKGVNKSISIPVSRMPNFEKFEKLEFIPTIESITGETFPAELSVEALLQYFDKIELSYPKTKSVPHLLDKLSSKYLEPLCINPTFIYHQPSIMSPLSKSISIKYGEREYEISRRFELFINGKEFINAYEEENSPFDQDAKFKLQQHLKDEYNDDETIVPDHKFLKAMEWGMPPTGGWGLGIDRLCMLLVDEQRIEEVLTFGTIPDVIRQ
ncbi:hypothetical protein WICMUC_001716 [Wickerhamomyces mucosus]|uniref:Lysine--tRNA ligase n=1 Tax=Wickerhamomyces mucosus TaxID=1378264 RepID=A0A9P8TFG2_9ASCO|nr:hypothetical protein WICMUC_001716 [Wickerhamomyces mucosus]